MVEKTTRVTDMGSAANLPLATESERDEELDTKPLRAGDMVGDYRIQGILGRGGMGTVYGAIHPLIGKKAAVKVLHPKMHERHRAVDRFLQEARAVNEIDHPNVIDIFAYGTLDDDRAYLVMERLTGLSLRDRIDRSRIPVAEAIDYFLQMCRALEAAHIKGVIHRDLKPDNVFLVEQRTERPKRVKLLDFGIAKFAFGQFSKDMTETGTFVGTPAYIAPEQAEGKKSTAASDVYAFGVMLFEALTGQRPFDSDSSMGVVAKHLYEAPPHASNIVDEVPRKLGNLIVKMMAKSPEDRPSLVEIREHLEELRRLHLVEERLDTSSRRPLTVALAAASLLIVAAIGAVAMSRDSGAAGESESTTVAPVAAPAPGQLVLTFDADDVTAYVDSVRVPVENRRATMEVRPGEHEIVAVVPGQPAVEKSVTAVSGKVAVIPMTMVAKAGKAPDTAATTEPAAAVVTKTTKKTPKKAAKKAAKKTAKKQTLPTNSNAATAPKEKPIGLGNDRLDPFND
jgi:serine/threonine-protein kinase